MITSTFPRKDCIFTIDPSTARDLDDALSCKPLTDGKTEKSVPFGVAGGVHTFVAGLPAVRSPGSAMCMLELALFLNFP